MTLEHFLTPSNPTPLVIKEHHPRVTDITTTFSLGNIFGLKKSEESNVCSLYTYDNTKCTLYKDGSVVCVGTKSLNEIKVVVKKLKRHLNESGYNTHHVSIKIKSVIGKVLFDFGFDLKKVYLAFLEQSRYNPELYSAVVISDETFNSTIAVYQSGKILIKAPSIEKMLFMYYHIAPKLLRYRV
ncbi:TATA-box-binding protein, putative [Entamoeba invadens IP1]|uniref:TATA-box-binding protein, putative n=1 Tax=Entamoeba invadens IP1 TaxID=370355 RepID=A0A0A1UG85_ENTIV|nr:TATA-box-binding protein, putative [Entamoeba invadens IP1]ELP94610.1 TATA-box-binding protein, putative [Entamoeba invadens IP1]|eukprot:XP_004261381.1 TATA-box-binding protein, putative [Entamoeba invadens IP1]